MPKVKTVMLEKTHIPCLSTLQKQGNFVRLFPRRENVERIFDDGFGVARDFEQVIPIWVIF